MATLTRVTDTLVKIKINLSNAISRILDDKLTELPSVADFGSIADGSTDNTSSIQKAIDSQGYLGNGSLHVNTGRHLVTSLLNKFGVRFTGQGVIGVPDGLSTIGTQEVRQLNSYADEHKYAFGMEYAYAYLHASRVDPATQANLLKCVLAGDSTIHGGNGEPNTYKPEILLSNMFRRIGLPNISIFNRAVPSTSWGDMNIIGDIGASTRLLLIKYGVNDAFGPKDQRHNNMVNAMRAKLQEIRSQPYGGLEWLTIVLVGPNSTNDSPNMRNEEWYESIRGIYASVAREFKCVYFDTYAFLRDSRVLAGLSMDNPFNDGRAIHPLSEMNMQIYGRLFDEMLSDNTLLTASLLSRTNMPIHVEAITPALLPDDPAFSPHHTLHYGVTANGWDYAGIVETERQADGLMHQTLYNQGNSRIQHRSKPIASNTWNKFTGKSYPLSLGNGWVNYGGSYNPATATLTADGLVVLSGTIKSGLVGAGNAMFTLPSGMSPKGYSRHHVVTGNLAAVGVVEFQTNGQCFVVAGLDNTLVSLEGITLLVA